MRTDAGAHKYPSTTRNRAPHKPILLLSVLDLYQQGELATNFIPISPELADIFTGYWDLVMPPGRFGHLHYPFFHLRNDGFWHLVARSGKEITLSQLKQIGGAGQLCDLVLGAQLDDELYRLVIVEAARKALRASIINTYFGETVRSLLLIRSEENAAAYLYSRELLERARGLKHSYAQSGKETQQQVRKQGFRKAVVAAYDHRCVLCGVRLVTDEGHTVATAAHIVPWSISQNDDLRNGLCLCRLCHWAFDEGLVTITQTYRIRLSIQMTREGNIPGHLSTLDTRPIFEPVEEVFEPGKDALIWHLKKVFLG